MLPTQCTSRLSVSFKRPDNFNQVSCSLHCRTHCTSCLSVSFKRPDNFNKVSCNLHLLLCCTVHARCVNVSFQKTKQFQSSVLQSASATLLHCSCKMCKCFVSKDQTISIKSLEVCMLNTVHISS